MVRDAHHRLPDHRRGTDGAHGRLRGGQPQAIDEFGLLVGAEEQVHGREPVLQPGAIALPDGTSRQHDAQRGVLGLEALQMPLSPDDLLLGKLPDRAGVDDDEVRDVEGRRLRGTRREEPTGHLLRVAPVHLAAERPDHERGQGPRFRPELAQAAVLGLRGTARRGRGRRHDLQDRQLGSAGRRSFDHRLAADSAMAARRGPSTSGGTQSVAWAGPYGPRSPW